MLERDRGTAVSSTEGCGGSPAGSVPPRKLKSIRLEPSLAPHPPLSTHAPTWKRTVKTAKLQSQSMKKASSTSSRLWQ